MCRVLGLAHTWAWWVLAWGRGIRPQNLRRVISALPQVCQARHLRLSPAFPREATDPRKRGDDRCSVQAQRGQATCPRPHSGGERPAWSAPRRPCSGARLCQVLTTDRQNWAGRPGHPPAARQRPGASLAQLRTWPWWTVPRVPAAWPSRLTPRLRGPRLSRRSGLAPPLCDAP